MSKKIDIDKNPANLEINRTSFFFFGVTIELWKLGLSRFLDPFLLLFSACFGGRAAKSPSSEPTLHCKWSLASLVVSRGKSPSNGLVSNNVYIYIFSTRIPCPCFSTYPPEMVPHRLNRSMGVDFFRGFFSHLMINISTLYKVVIYQHIWA